MTAFICETCGVQHAPGERPPERCAVCEDERQYLGWEGQRWTTLARLRQRHQADVREEEPGLLGIGMRPPFAIGQRALLIRAPAGNVLWDCVPLLCDEIIDAVSAYGGLSAIAVSHPHFYASMVEWAQAFDVPVYVHEADRQWLMRSDPHVTPWGGDALELQPGIELVRLGGHFAGGTVLHWAAGDSARGALLSSDVVMVVPDRRWVSFMRSYPNLIPLPAAEVQRMAAALEPYAFERIYGGWFGRVVRADAKRAIDRSVRRYLRALAGDFRPSAGLQR
jgi:hypothetical protein